MKQIVLSAEYVYKLHSIAPITSFHLANAMGQSNTYTSYAYLIGFLNIEL